MSRIKRRRTLTGSPFSSSLFEWTQRGIIRSIQYGTITIGASGAGTATITAVRTANALALHLGVLTASTGTSVNVGLCTLQLTDSVTVTANHDDTTTTITLAFAVIEFVDGIVHSLQRGTIALTSVASNTASITAVNVAKAMLILSGWYLNNQTQVNNIFPTLTLTNSTTVTLARSGATGAAVGAYQVVEFY